MIKSAGRDDATAIAREVPVKTVPKKRVPGMFKGEFELGSAFFEPLPPEELAVWE
jgi:hypothetical protein